MTVRLDERVEGPHVGRHAGICAAQQKLQLSPPSRQLSVHSASLERGAARVKARTTLIPVALQCLAEINRSRGKAT